VAKKKTLDRKTWTVIISASVIVLVLLVIAVVTFLQQSAIVNTERGNTSGNIANSGMVVEGAGDIYINYMGIYKLGEEGIGEKLSDLGFSNMAMEGDWIYYCNNSDYGRLYKFNVKTKENIKLHDYDASYINVVDGMVYFVSSKDFEVRGIFRISTQGGEATQLSKYDAVDLNVYGGNLYFVNTSDKRKIYMTDLNGDNAKVITTDNSSMMAMDGGWIYYGNTDGLYRVRTDGSSRRRLSDLSVSDLNVHGKYIYHCYVDLLNNAGDQSFYRTRIDGSSTELITKDTAIGICYADNWIYYQRVYSNFDMYRVPADGGKPELVIDAATAQKKK